MKLPRPAASVDLSGERAISWSAAGIPYAESRPASRRFVGRAFRAFCVPVKPGRSWVRILSASPIFSVTYATSRLVPSVHHIPVIFLLSLAT